MKVLIWVGCAYFLCGCSNIADPRDGDRRRFLDPLLTLSREYCRTAYTPVHWPDYFLAFSEQGAMARVIKQGTSIAPLLIEHLDDKRETKLVFFFNPHYPYNDLERPVRIKLGVIALACLQDIIGGRPGEDGMGFGMTPTAEEMKAVKERWEVWWQRNGNDLEHAEISRIGE